MMTVCLGASERDALAGVNFNCNYDLADLPDPMADWTASGAGTRTGTRIDGERSYSRSDLNLSNGREFLLEAVVRAQDLSAAGDHPARMILVFPVHSPGPGAEVFHLEVRLRRQADGGHTVVLVDVGSGPSDLCSLTLDWHQGDYRVRVKRRKEAATDLIYLQAEESGAWDDPSTPYSGQGVAAAGLSHNTVEAPAVTFGNCVPGALTSFWQSVHVTTCDAAHTQLPYWPAQPPVPALTFMDRGWNVPQRVAVMVDCTAVAYLANDEMTCVLVTAKNGTQRTPTFPAPSMMTVTNRFEGLSDNQTVSSYVEVRDVSGRTRVGGSASTLIPNRTAKGIVIQVR